MDCKYCKAYSCNRCPDYIPPKTNYYCSICGEGIYDGEEYIVNEENEYAHYECVSYGRDMAEFLGYNIRKMNEESD